MSPEPDTCPECGDDAVAEGWPLCTDCLEADVQPDDQDPS